jgi:putative ABC transport system permease protein
MTLSVTGIILVENFKYSFQTELSKRGKEILGSDIGLSSRYPLSIEKLNGFYKLIDDDRLEKSNTMSMFSMAKVGTSIPRLVSLQILDGKFPFYGGVTISNQGKVFKNLKIPKMNSLWVSPELLGEYEGQDITKLKVGGLDFQISGLIDNDTGQTFGMSGVAPRVFINLESIKDANLLQQGSTVRYYYHVKTSSTIDQNLVESINELIDDNSVSVMTPNKSSEQVGRLMAYLADFLGLVSLVAMFLSSIGLFYLFRSHITKKEKNFAILNSLGLSLKKIRSIYWFYSILLIFTATIFSFVVASVLVPLAQFFINLVVPFNLPIFVDLRALAFGGFVGFFGVLLLVYPILKISLSKKISSLFNEMSAESDNIGFLSVFYFVPYLIFFSSISLYVANSYRIGGWFLCLFFSVALITYPLGKVILRILFAISHKFSFDHKISLRYLHRYHKSTITIFICLTLASMLINIIPQIEESLRGDLLSSDDRTDRPSFFLFDIQDEQVLPLQKFIADEKQSLLALSPMVRARITKINDVDVLATNETKLTREEEREQQFKNRGMNLSYRDKLLASETIISGREIKGIYNEQSDELPKVSIEKRFADRLKIGLGDRLEFSILGVPQEVIVENIRSVKWTSFLPNFFIQFQRGVLEDAPKTWLAGIKAKENRKSIKFKLYKKFPNVSVVDVSKVVSKVLGIMEHMTFALKSMSLLCLLVGFSVLYSLISHQISERKKDIFLLHIIGMSYERIFTMLRKEFLFITLIATSFGALFGLLVSFLMSQLFFDGSWHGTIVTPIASIVVSLVLAIIVVNLKKSSVVRNLVF